MRAVDHCIEGLCSVYFSESSTATPEKQAEVEAALVKGLDLLLPSLLVSKQNPENVAARRSEMLGVIEALRGLKAGVPMGASHGIGHQLGPLGVGHGETSCVMLPRVLQYNALNGGEWVIERQRRALTMFWENATVADRLTSVGLNKETSQLGEVVLAFVRQLGLPTSLMAVGIGRDKLSALAQSAMTDRYIPTNPAPITEDHQILDILEMALGEENT